MRHHAFAAAMGLLTAAFLAPCSQSQAASADPTGYWYKPDAERESKIQVFKCGKAKNQLCAKIAWLKDPKDSKGRPLHDIRNEEPLMRDRPIVGLAIFTALTPSAPATWNGQIYNPEDGHTYTATLTVLSRKEIKLRGCKAWLLCGEKQWLRTSAPEELTPVVPAEGTQQIEASATPQSPPAADSVAAAEAAAPSAEATASAAPSDAALPQDNVQAMAEPQATAEESQSAEALPKPVEEIATPAVPAVEYNGRSGYGFLNVSTGPDAAQRISGENVSSMIVMTEPLAAGAVAPGSGEPAQAAKRSMVPLPEQKSKVTPKPIATASVKPATKPVTQAKSTEQAVPQEATAADATDPDTQDAALSQSAQADASMVDSAPLTRRQRRLLRKQQQQGEPLLPWMR
jgi:uncharacterized protein (DUF2147 family)